MLDSILCINDKTFNLLEPNAINVDFFITFWTNKRTAHACPSCISNKNPHLIIWKPLRKSPLAQQHTKGAPSEKKNWKQKIKTRKFRRKCFTNCFATFSSFHLLVLPVLPLLHLVRLCFIIVYVISSDVCFWLVHVKCI